jgi:hypothetical protein
VAGQTMTNATREGTHWRRRMGPLPSSAGAFSPRLHRSLGAVWLSRVGAYPGGAGPATAEEM